MKYAQNYIGQAAIPDIQLSFGGQQIQLNDIKFINSQIPGISFDLSQEDQGAYSSIQGINFTLSFTFKLQQSHYPYMQDNGTGFLYLIDTQLSGLLQCNTSDTCQGTLEVSMQGVQLLINQLEIQLDSSLSYLYNGIMQMLTEQLKDMFNTVLQQPIYEALVQVANDGLANSSTASHIEKQNINGYPALDERYYQIIVNDSYFDSTISGLACWSDENETHCSGIYNNDSYDQPQYGTTNDDVQYYWHSGSFQSQLQLIYDRKMDKLQNSNKPCDNFKFVKTGATFTCYTQDNSQLLEINYLAKFTPTLYQRDTLLYLIGFQLQINQILNDVQIDQEQYINSLNNALQNTTLPFTNANYVNADKCYYIQWSESWAEFSCNFDGQV